MAPISAESRLEAKRAKARERQRRRRERLKKEGENHSAHLEELRLQAIEQRRRETEGQRLIRQQRDQVCHQAQRGRATEEEQLARQQVDQVRHQVQRERETEREQLARRQADRVRHQAQRSRQARQGALKKALGHHTVFKSMLIDGNDVHGGVHKLQPMRTICSYCSAIKWPYETANQCCKKGRIRLPRYSEAPAELLSMFKDSEFRRMIRAYNSAFAFTSLGASQGEGLRVDESVAGHNGVYTFRVQGAICHRIGSLLPHPNEQPNFAQIYIVDPDMEARARRRCNLMTGLNLMYVAQIESLMEKFNPFAQQFLKAHEIIAQKRQELAGIGNQVPLHQDPDIDLTLRLHLREGDDQRTHNLPQQSEVAVVLVEDGNARHYRDLLLYTKDRSLMEIFETSAWYDPLQYPLLFPKGELGWTPNIQYANGATLRNKREIPLREFVAYRLHTRENEPPLLHRGGRLFQQYVVDQWAKEEQQRLRYIFENQHDLRAECYRGVRDAVFASDEGISNIRFDQIGKRVILPASFTGSPRYMYQQYQDSMAIVREFGKPDLFVTMTCNPNWPEIKYNLLPNQTAQDRPDIVARVWHLKLKALMRDLGEGIFGAQKARIQVTEFQKRGLPHAHILIILCNEYKPRTADDYDALTSAEIPDKTLNPILYKTVMKCMMHGPCGGNYPNSPCMKDGRCTKGFPRSFCNSTQAHDNKYPVYVRRTRERGVLEFGGKQWDNFTANQWVVPYNPYLSHKYNCHINVEVCTTVTSVKYLYKYVYKGSDKATISIERRDREPNEIRRYLHARYISPVEACQRLFTYPIQDKSHSVTMLPVHLPEQSFLTFQNDSNIEEICESGEVTKLTEFFKLCSADEFASQLVYYDIPKFYRWDNKNRCWKSYRTNIKSIGRMVHCSPSDSERFFLRLLLCNRKGPKSFIDLRTVSGIEFPTYQEAAMACNLIEHDSEWRNCMNDAAIFQMPYQLRQLFVTILTCSAPGNIIGLYAEFYPAMSEDYQRSEGLNVDHERIKFLTLKSIDTLLAFHKKSLSNFGKNFPILDEFPEWIRVPQNNVWIEHERNGYQQEILRDIVSRNDQLNEGQREIYNTILKSVNGEYNGQKLYFIDGPGGSGKSFLLEQLLAIIRLSGKIAIAVASSGIAAQLLMGGRTAHSAFNIPLDINRDSTCNISKQSKQAELLKETSIIFWDEAPMTHRYAFEAFDKTMRDIRDCDEPFGGIIIVLSGDFRQILPVVKNGDIGQVISACIKYSSLWVNFQTLRLTVNMRVLTAPSITAGNEIEQFSEYLLSIGEGRQENALELDPKYIKIPEDMLLDVPPSIESEGSNVLPTLIDKLYGEIETTTDLIAYFSSRAILTPVNIDVYQVNEIVAERMSTSAHIYTSQDSVEDATEDLSGLFPIEYLNSLNFSGIPPHNLTLKVGMPVMLIRNLNSREGLCNGTRLRINNLRDHCIQATIMTGAYCGRIVFVPRILFITEDKDKKFPFRLRRKQFPIIPAFAMTINKAQGQSLHHLGLYLPSPVFSHGQLYVALSRVTSRNNVTIAIENPLRDEEGSVVTKNVVYDQVLN